jgi:5-methylthioribose kinase
VPSDAGRSRVFEGAVTYPERVIFMSVLKRVIGSMEDSKNEISCFMELMSSCIFTVPIIFTEKCIHQFRVEVVEDIHEGASNIATTQIVCLC